MRWIWNRAEEGEASKTPYASYYPGDAYVNYIGFDAYNWELLGEVALANRDIWPNV